MRTPRGLVVVMLSVTAVGACAPDDTDDPAPSSPSSTSAPTTAGAEPSASASFAGWQAVFDTHEASVLRVSALSCDDGAWMGTAFAVGEDLLLTAAHVAEGARTISVQRPSGEVAPAEVVGMVRDHDVALLRSTEPLEVPALELAESVPGRGSPLAVLGYPLGTYDLRIVQGLVAGLPEPVEYDGQRVDRAFITDAAVNGGNSGGPVLDTSGRVIGLVSGTTQWDDSGDPVEDTSLVIPVEDISDDLGALRVAEPSPSRCPGEDEVEVPEAVLEDWDGELRLSVQDPSDTAAAIGQVLYTHGLSINDAAYASAFELFTTAQQRRLGGLDEWSDGVAASYWADIDLLSVSGTRDDATATVALRTIDASDAGDVCRLWRLNYTLRASGDGWLIDKAKGSRTECSG